MMTGSQTRPYKDTFLVILNFDPAEKSIIEIVFECLPIFISEGILVSSAQGLLYWQAQRQPNLVGGRAVVFSINLAKATKIYSREVFF